MYVINQNIDYNAIQFSPLMLTLSRYIYKTFPCDSSRQIVKDYPSKLR
jgi:hypothetical protein